MSIAISLLVFALTAARVAAAGTDPEAPPGSDSRLGLPGKPQPAGAGAASAPQAPPPFWKSRLSDVDAAVHGVKKGRARVLAQSAGKRDLYLVTYGGKQDLKGTANYNSACGGTDPASYARKDGTHGGTPATEGVDAKRADV